MPFNADGRGDTVAGLEVAGLILLVILVYGLSLKWNPYVRCSRCKGQARIKGWVFRNAQHVCPKCNGTGRQPRLGRRIFFK